MKNQKIYLSHKVRAVAALDGVLNDKVPTTATQELGIRHQAEARA